MDVECPKCGGTMTINYRYSIAGGRESTRSETLSAIITLLGEVAKDLPEQSVPNAKIQAAIQLLEAMPPEV